MYKYIKYIYIYIYIYHYQYRPYGSVTNIARPINVTINMIGVITFIVMIQPLSSSKFGITAKYNTYNNIVYSIITPKNQFFDL